VLVINLRDAPARRHALRASIIELEPGGARWVNTGINVRVMEPGQPSGRYHWEPNQGTHYPVSDAAARHGASVRHRTLSAPG